MAVGRVQGNHARPDEEISDAGSPSAVPVLTAPVPSSLLTSLIARATGIATAGFGTERNGVRRRPGVFLER